MDLEGRMVGVGKTDRNTSYLRLQFYAYNWKRRMERETER